jgi:hypothetical protein
MNIFSLARTKLGKVVVGVVFGKLSSYLPLERVIESDKAVAFHHPQPLHKLYMITK